MKIELVIGYPDAGDRIVNRGERFVIDLAAFGEAMIRYAHDAPLERDRSTSMSIANGCGGHITLLLKVEAKP